MPNYLAEQDLKDELAKKVNLGLRVMKTGVSEKLRDYDKANKEFMKWQASKDHLDDLKEAIKKLIEQCRDQIGKHKLFTQASAYLNEVVKAAERRQKEATEKYEAILKEKKALIASYLELSKQFDTVTTAERFHQSKAMAFVEALQKSDPNLGVQKLAGALKNVCGFCKQDQHVPAVLKQYGTELVPVINRLREGKYPVT